METTIKVGRIVNLATDDRDLVGVQLDFSAAPIKISQTTRIVISSISYSIDLDKLVEALAENGNNQEEISHDEP